MQTIHYTKQRIMNSSLSPTALIRSMPSISSIRYSKPSAIRALRYARRGSSTVVVGAVVLTALVILGGLWFLGVFNKTSTTTSPPPSSSNFSGNINLAASGYDYFNHATSYTAATNFNVLFYTDVGGSYQLVATNSGTAQIPTGAGGTLYAEIQIPSGQSYYVDPVSTQNQNSYVTAKSYSPDLGGQSGHSYWVYSINLNAVTKPNLGNPTYDFYAVLSTYALPSLNTPAARASPSPMTALRRVHHQ